MQANDNVSCLQTSISFRHKVLGISQGISDVGTIKWDLALCLLFAWLVILVCIWNGIKTSGKVSNVAVTVLRCLTP